MSRKTTIWALFDSKTATVAKAPPELYRDIMRQFQAGYRDLLTINQTSTEAT